MPALAGLLALTLQQRGMDAMMLSRIAVLGVALASAGLVAAARLETTAPYEPGEEFAGGETTVGDEGVNAFSHPAANLSIDRQSAFFIGNSFFKKNWVEAPASTTGRDGLGPHFIARACASCHTLDGRGAPPRVENAQNVEAPVGLLMRLSVPGDGGRAGAVGEPSYGGQLNNAAVAGVHAEARVEIRYDAVPGRFADGTEFVLRKPVYGFDALAYGAMDSAVMVSPRIAPQVIGLGLLEAIPEESLLAIAQRQARQGEGISGRPNRVWDQFRHAWVIGRFGWKANVGSVAHQTASAFNGDMGITSTRFPREECTPAQTDCLERLAREAAWRAQRGETSVDIDERALARTIFYTTTLAVPARRDVRDPQVLRGKQLFHEAQCASCHVPRHLTGQLEAFPELSGQTIFPYTDLLLHDMGAGLADGRPDFAANGQEWRTPPLWGIGLIPAVNGHEFLLHDGRARNIMEAILWHGGEAEQSKGRVLNMPEADRKALVRFVRSL